MKLAPVYLIRSLVLLLSMSASAYAASGLTGARVLKGSAILSGKTLRAEANGVTYRLPNGVELQLNPDTELVIGNSVRLSVKPKFPAIRVPTFSLRQGTVRFSIVEQHANRAAVLLKVPRQVHLLAKEGRSIAIAQPNRVTIAAYSGTNIGAINNRWKPLLAGQAKTVDAGNPTGRPRKILEAPAAQLQSSFLLEGATAEVDWPAVAGATRYELQAQALDQYFAPTLTRHTSVQLTQLKPGLYRLRVRTIDSTGLMGPFSAPLSLKILGLRLPEQAIQTNDGTILLARYKSVQLLGAEGLQMAFGNDPEFVSAPAFVGLGRNKLTIVHLRDPSSQKTLELRLEPLSPVAHINFGAKDNHWPKTGLPVQIALTTASGRSLPDKIRVKPQITVNLKTVKVRWRRSPGMLEALLAPPRTQGPWVIRADVQDAEGNLVEHSFHELNAIAD